jgi:triosephosphate isomerase (TIM)
MSLYFKSFVVMRKKIVAGNWKMNKTFGEAEKLIADISESLEGMELKETEVILCPPFIYLEMATDIAAESKFEVGAQNMNDHDSGAFTGEISAIMLNSLDVKYVIIGHSERRQHMHESHEFLAGKVNAAIRHQIQPIFCCGEILAERETGIHFSVVKKQLEDSLFHLSPGQFQQVIIAYEPVWAIGTGVNATPEQAQEMHLYIRDRIAENYDRQIADDTTILYGGSCNSGNARELFIQPDVDGGLIGGSSLKADEFISIISSF